MNNLTNHIFIQVFGCLTEDGSNQEVVVLTNSQGFWKEDYDVIRFESDYQLNFDNSEDRDDIYKQILNTLKNPIEPKYGIAFYELYTKELQEKRQIIIEK